MPSTFFCAFSICLVSIPGFDRFVFLNAQSLYDRLHPFAAEQTHQIVLQGDAELCLARVSLTSGTTSQLVVYTSGFVTLRTDDAQTAQLYYLFLLFPSLFLVLFVKLLELVSCLQQLLIVALHETGGKCDGFLVVASLLPFHFFASNSGLPPSMMSVPLPAMLVAIVISSETSRLCDDLRFLFMLLCVQDIKMLDAPFFQSICDQLGLFDGNGTYQHRLSRFVSLCPLLSTIDLYLPCSVA